MDESERRPGPIKNMVLVHGDFVDGARWEGVFDLLARCGYSVSVVQKPTSSLTVGPAATKQTLEQQEGDVVLLGHYSYGVAITEAGNHPKVKHLVYITAFAAGAGESVSSLIANPPPSAPILPSQNGFLFLDQARFVASFAATSSLPRPRSWPSPGCSGGRRSAGDGDHAIYLSKPKPVADIIDAAAIV
jgi:hypothetical protein